MSNEADPEKKAIVCAKCGSRHVMPNVRIIDRADNNMPMRLTASVDRKPTARVFKNPLECPMRAVVCGDCGYAELYVEKPELLYEVYRQTSL
jgi:DNA-directed RNA polymerase subunit RPC12/RpoP